MNRSNLHWLNWRDWRLNSTEEDSLLASSSLWMDTNMRYHLEPGRDDIACMYTTINANLTSVSSSYAGTRDSITMCFTKYALCSGALFKCVYCEFRLMWRNVCLCVVMCVCFTIILKFGSSTKYNHCYADWWTNLYRIDRNLIIDQHNNRLYWLSYVNPPYIV